MLEAPTRKSPVGATALPVVRRLTELPRPLVRCLLAARRPSAAAMDAARDALGSTAVEWSAIAEILDASGVGPLAFTRLQQLGMGGGIDEKSARAWKADRLHAELQCNVQRRDAIAVANELSRLEIPHAFIKGFVVREWLYDPPWVRAGADTDLLVRPDCVEATRAAILSLDFVQAARSDVFTHFRPATPMEILDTESKHYELAQFAKIVRFTNAPSWLFNPDFRRQAPSAFEMLPDGPVLNSVIDVHWALHFFFANDDPLESVINVPSRGGDLNIPTLRVEWQLLYTAFKLYFEAFDRPGWGLHMLADLAALLDVGRESIGWDWLEAQAGQKRLEAMLFHTLSAADQLLEQSVVPPALLDRLAELQPAHPRNPETNLDFGDFLPSVLKRRVPGVFLPSPDRVR